MIAQGNNFFENDFGVWVCNNKYQNSKICTSIFILELIAFVKSATSLWWVQLFSSNNKEQISSWTQSDIKLSEHNIRGPSQGGNDQTSSDSYLETGTLHDYLQWLIQQYCNLEIFCKPYICRRTPPRWAPTCTGSGQIPVFIKNVDHAITWAILEFMLMRFWLQVYFFPSTFLCMYKFQNQWDAYHGLVYNPCPPRPTPTTLNYHKSFQPSLAPPHPLVWATDSQRDELATQNTFSCFQFPLSCVQFFGRGERGWFCVRINRKSAGKC